MIQLQHNAGSTLVSLDRAALFLDLDGTLAPIAPTPQAVKPEPRRSAILSRAKQALDGRLAVVSGRRIEEIDRICEGRIDCVAGVHGLEWRGPDLAQSRQEPHPLLAHAVEALTVLAADNPRLLVEQKDLSVTLHYRAAPEAATRVEGVASRIAWSTGLVLQRGKMVVELRTPGPDKGDAVRAFMARVPFSGAVPIYVGDDLTDEPAFRTAQALGGHGVCVSAQGPTAAHYRLPAPEAVLDWIEQSLLTGEFSLGGRA